MSKDPAEQHKLVAAAAYAVARAQWDDVLALIDQYGLDVNVRVGYNRRTLVHNVIAVGNLKMLKELRRRGAELEGLYDQQGQDAIHMACTNGRADMVEWMIAQGVDIENMGKPAVEGESVRPFSEPRKTPLICAIERKQVPIVRLLLEKGANPDSRTQDGSTALMVAVRHPANRPTRQIFSLLRHFGADVDAVNDAGNSVLMEACNNKMSRQYSELLADCGAQLDNPKATPDLEQYMNQRLHNKLGEKFVQGRKSIVRLSADKPFTRQDLFLPNEQGYAPLDSHETWQRLPELADALAKAGEPLCKADFLREREDGRTWVQRAIECGAYDVLHDYLHQIGDPIRGVDFANPQQPSQCNVLGVIAEDSFLGLTALANPKAWAHAGTSDVYDFSRSLPNDLRAQFRNAHQLASHLRQQQGKQAAVGR
jgi:hypothetical protein